jgi:HK97 family phage major capsid protein
VETREEVKAQLEQELKGIREQLSSFTDDAKKELKNVGKESEETKSKIDQALVESGELRQRLEAMEKKVSKSSLGNEVEHSESVGEIVTKSDPYKEFAKVGAMRRTSKIDVGTFHKTAIVNATGQNQPLVPAERVSGIFNPLQQRLTIRNILPVLPTTSNLIEFVKESSSTNNAKPQGLASSPQVYENVAKAESAMAFTLSFEPVQTIAHWIPVSRQVQDDAPALQAYIDGRMTYFLKLKEEDQLLNGSGSGGNLHGLVTQATAYDTGLNAGGDTDIDKLRHSMLQLELANASVSSFVFNPTDWHNIELIKTTGTASSGQYIFANPHNMGVPAIWGRPVVVSQSITAGHFLVGDFPLAAALYDRMQSTVEVSRDYSDFFVKNMMAILCEERLSLVVYRPEALVYGAF